MIKRAFSFFLPAALLVVLDRVSKLVFTDLLADRGPIVLIRGILELRYVHNTGAAFGMFKGMGALLGVFAAAVIIYCFLLFMRIPSERVFFSFRLTLIFIAAGALGNLIDRILYSYVIDFIYFSLIDFPVFNLADVFVTCSVFFILYLFLFRLSDSDIKRIPFRILQR